MSKAADLRHLAVPETRIPVRVTPKAAANRIAVDADGLIRVYVTTVPEGGKATAALVLLAGRRLSSPMTLRLALAAGPQTSSVESLPAASVIAAVDRLAPLTLIVGVALPALTSA